MPCRAGRTDVAVPFRVGRTSPRTSRFRDFIKDKDL